MASNYIMIPYFVLKKDISDKAKMVYGIVQGFFEGDCYVSNAWLAKRLKCSESVIKRTIKELKDAGLLFSTVKRTGLKITKRILTIPKTKQS